MPPDGSIVFDSIIESEKTGLVGSAVSVKEIRI